MKHALFALASIIVVECFVAPASQAAGDPIADFFHGREISIYTGYPPGGGYDIYGRLVARHLGRFIPGNPNVIPQNMPGAGSLKAANYLYNVAPKDGTALGLVAQTVALEQVLGTAGISYDAAKFNWIGRVTTNVEIEILWHAAPVKSIGDAMREETVIGGTGPIAPAEVFPKVLNAIVGTKFKVISGYEGSADSCNAMEKSEVMGCLISWVGLKSGRSDWVRDHQVNVVVQYAINKHSDLPDVPTMVELGKTDNDRKVLTLYASGAEIGRSVLAPPGIPEARVAALREAFDKMVIDSKFIADVQRQHLDLEPLTGSKLQEIVRGSSDVSPAVVARAREVHNAR